MKTIGPIRFATLFVCAVFAGAGCFSTAKRVEVTYGFDDFGVAVCSVNGAPMAMSEAQRKAQIQAIVAAYCPAGLPL